ncbi:hypothetical protein A2U01_0044602, partial [Trifolium medium]|nr:hypothetical protein [Trifolium medium]
MGEVLDRSLGNVPIGGSFTSDPLLSSSGGDLGDPYLDALIWLRKKSIEIGSAVDMVKNWTEEDYVLPVNRSPLPWVVEKIEGVLSKYSDDDLVSNLSVDLGPSCDWFVHPIMGDDRLCSSFYRDSFVPMYKCMFDVIGLRFPLSPFE